MTAGSSTPPAELLAVRVEGVALDDVERKPVIDAIKSLAGGTGAGCDCDCDSCDVGGGWFVGS